MRGSAAFRVAVAPGGALAGPWVRDPLWTRARAVPSLDLRFADNKSLVDAATGAQLVTFTRASSGTFVGSNGLIQTAATNEARFDHNPTTGESLGLLVEEARTNVLLNSATLSTQSVTVAAAANTLSFYGTGTVTLTGVSTAGPLVGTGANNRVSLTFTPTVGVLILTVSGSVTNAQLEAGAFPTSYIPTTTATVTRAADVASITGANFGTTRTNLLVRSEEFENVAWTPSNVATPTADIAVAPDGTLTADKIITSNGLNSGLVFQTFALSASTTYTFSAYAKAVEWGWTTLQLRGPENVSAGAWFDLINGSVGTIDAGVSATIQAVGNGWYRCTVTKTTGTGVSTSRQRIYTTNANNVFTTGDGTSGILLWGAQLETSSNVTPYIPTTTAAVTVFESSWYRQDEGTVFAEAISVATNTNVFSISDNSTNNRIQLETGSSTRRFRITSSGSARYDNSVSYTFGTQGKTAGAYLNTSTNHATNGTLGTNSTASPLPVVDRIYIGSNAAGSLPNNGPIKRLAYWGQRFANSTLQAISQP